MSHAQTIMRAVSAKTNPSAWHKLTICSPCRTKCGYCHGERLHALDQDNPQPSPIGEPSIVILPIKEDDHDHEDDHHAHEDDSSSSSNELELSNEDADDDETVPITKSTTSDAYCCHFHNISPKAYLSLINRGWRRSGKLLYFPKNWQSCCASIPIRLDTPQFQITKSQKRVLKRFQQALGTPLATSSSSSCTRTTIKSCNSKEKGENGSKPAATCSSKYKRQKQQVDGKGWNNAMQSHAKLVLQDAGLLDRLQEEVRAQVDGLLQEKQGGNVHLKMMQEGNALGKLCLFKCTNFSKPKRSTSTPPHISMEVTLSNMVCPALHGKTKGQMDKMELGRNIVENMNLSDILNYESSVESSISSIQVKEIALHEKSAHINVQIHVSFDDASLRTIAEEKPVKKEIDVIADFIRASGGLISGEEDSIAPPYRITVRTIPSHISGCMPQVHRLHCKYQNAIHGDEDPYGGVADGNNVAQQNAAHSDEEDDDFDDDQDAKHEKITEANIAALYPQYDENQRKKIYKRYVQCNPPCACTPNRKYASNCRMTD